MTDETRELPPGWVWARLEEIADLKGGIQKGKKREASDVLRTVPYLRVANVQRGYLDLTEVTDIGATETEIDQLRLKPGDVLFNEGGDRDKLGRGWVWNGEISECIHQNHVFRARILGRCIIPRLLSWWGNTAGQRYFFDEGKQTTNLASLNMTKLGRLPVVIPPSAEQQRILDALDSHIPRLDAAVASLERVQRNLKRYRASVLQAAVEGRLVPTEAELAKKEGRSYEPASKLLERILVERRRQWIEREAEKAVVKAKAKADKRCVAADNAAALEQARTVVAKKYEEPTAPDTENLSELPEGWCWATVDQIMVGIDAGSNFRCDERPPDRDEFGVVKVSAVTWGVFDDAESKTCVGRSLVDSRAIIRVDDFLISRANTIQLVGACVIVHAVTRQVMLSDKILRLRLVGGLDRWLLWVLRSQLGRRQIESLATGNQESMRNISQASIARICVPLPPMSEVGRLIETVDRNLSIGDELMVTARAGARKNQALRQSILRWAFEGKLVDQDPNDEPTSVLLDRIKTERAAGEPAKRGAPRGRKQKAPKVEAQAQSITQKPVAAGGVR